MGGSSFDPTFAAGRPFKDLENTPRISPLVKTIMPITPRITSNL